MTVEEGLEYFKAVPAIREKLETMLTVLDLDMFGLANKPPPCQEAKLSV